MKYIDEFIVDRINSKKERLESMLLDRDSLKNILKEILVEFTYTSNSIDGSTLTMDDTRRILETGDDFMGKRPYFQHLTINHSNAFEYINRNQDSSLSTTGLLELHEIVMRGIDKEAGSFRDHKTRNKIYVAIDGFLDKLNNSPEYHPIETSAILQSYFHQIRPFNYGTGSTARLAAKWILNHHGYIFGLPLDSYEMKYYRKCAEKSGKGTIYPLVKMMTKCVEETLDLLLNRVKTLNYIPIEEAMKKNKLDVSQMIDLIKRGEVRAYKRDGNIYVVDQKMENVSLGAEILELKIYEN